MGLRVPFRFPRFSTQGPSVLTHHLTVMTFCSHVSFLQPR